VAITRHQFQSGNSGKGQTVTLTMSPTPTSGRLLVLWYYQEGGQSEPSSAPSNGPWTTINTVDFNLTERVRAYYKISEGDESSIAVTFAGSEIGSMACYEISDSAGELSLDQNATASWSLGTTFTATSITPTSGATLKLVVGGLATQTRTVSTWTNSYTERQDVNESISRIVAADRETDTSGGTTATISGSTSGGSIHMSFTPPGGTSAVLTRRRK
jgi:hypothetical protein